MKFRRRLWRFAQEDPLLFWEFICWSYERDHSFVQREVSFSIRISKLCNFQLCTSTTLRYLNLINLIIPWFNFLSERTPLDTTKNSSPSDMLVMLSVPSYISCRDLLQFLAPYRSHLIHIKVIRENTPNQYMALLKCKSEVGSSCKNSIK